jgi:hypothetical protein
MPKFKKNRKRQELRITEARESKISTAGESDSAAVDEFIDEDANILTRDDFFKALGKASQSLTQSDSEELGTSE